MNTPAARPIDLVIARLRADPIDFAGDITEVRRRFQALTRPPGDDEATVQESVMDGVPVLDTGAGVESSVVVFAHAGGYVAGSAAASLPLTLDLARATGRRVVSVDYGLAPEHPFPVARDEIVAVYEHLREAGTPAHSIAFVGASAGGGLVLQAARAIRDRGSPLPAALAVLSPFSDLTLTGESVETNAARDPSLTRRGLAAAAAHYAATKSDLAPDVDSLRRLPPLYVQVGSLEILLSDAIQLAARAGMADVHAVLEVWPGMVHVFPTFAAVLPEGVEALRRIGTHLDKWMPGGR